MTLPTFSSARDEIFGLFKTAWDAGTPAVNGGLVPVVFWEGVDPGTPPPVDAPWARVTCLHSTARQTTFGGTGSRRFRRFGIVTAQIFSPLSLGSGLTLAEKLAIIARGAYEGKSTPSGIWFLNTRIREIGVDSSWFQMNVMSEFQYDEIL